MITNRVTKWSGWLDYVSWDDWSCSEELYGSLTSPSAMFSFQGCLYE